MLRLNRIFRVMRLMRASELIRIFRVVRAQYKRKKAGGRAKRDYDNQTY